MAKIDDFSVEVSYKEYLEMLKAHFFVQKLVEVRGTVKNAEQFTFIIMQLLEDYFPYYLEKEEQK